MYAAPSVLPWGNARKGMAEAAAPPRCARLRLARGRPMTRLAARSVALDGSSASALIGQTTQAIAELLGVAGLILPGLTKIQPRLTPLAALGLMVVMVLAVIYHLQRGEPANIGFNVVVFILAGFVAYGR